MTLERKALWMILKLLYIILHCQDSVLAHKYERELDEIQEELNKP